MEIFGQNLNLRSEGIPLKSESFSFDIRSVRTEALI